jgi:branched-chain amino acid transport system permease protein
MTVAEAIFINVALATSYQLLFGYVRLISLGHAAFFALAAYVSALLITHAGVGHPLAWAIAIGVVLVAASIIGWMTLRLEPLLLAIATLALAQAIQSLLATLSVTGGENGLPVPPISFSWWEQPTTDYVITAGLLVVVLVVIALVVMSPLGKQLVAVGDDPVAARASGIRVSQTLVFVFVVGSLLAAVAGLMFSQSTKFITPELSGVDLSILVLAMVALGGIRSMTGAAAAAVVLTLLPIVLPLQEYNALLFGVLILAVFRVSPEGFFAPAVRRIARRSGV